MNQSGALAIQNCLFLHVQDGYYPFLLRMWEDKGVAVERCRGYRCAIAKESAWNRAYAAAHYGDYADEDEDEIRDDRINQSNGWKL